ncbi:MAG: hypothetical protein J6V09_02845 [Clostridia bacterium]|nr:hypothetical protein [Clostridia bacterium]
MRFRMLGTGHGECKIKRAVLKDFRRHGGVLVDNKILIDAPCDIFEVADDLGFSDMFDGVSDVIISHSHPSHFSADTVVKLGARKKIRVYATGKVLDLIPDTESIEKIKLSTSQPIEIDGYTLYSMTANHATDIKGEMCLNFVLSRDKAVLYAVDGGGLSFSAWKTMSSLKIDAAIVDCALEVGAYSAASVYHNNLAAAVAMRDTMVSAKIAEPNVKFILTHIPSSRKRQIHDELSGAARGYGMSVAYDGYFFSV